MPPGGWGSSAGGTRSVVPEVSRDVAADRLKKTATTGVAEPGASLARLRTALYELLELAEPERVPVPVASAPEEPSPAARRGC